MLRLALASLRTRKGAAVGGFVALFFAAAMVCACGVLLETGLRGTVPPGRYAGAPVVVTGDQQIHWTDIEHKQGKTKKKVKSKDLAERVWLPASIGAGCARSAAPPSSPTGPSPRNSSGSDHSFHRRRRWQPTYGHNWSAARLTPYRIVAGEHRARTATSCWTPVWPRGRA